MTVDTQLDGNMYCVSASFWVMSGSHSEQGMLASKYPGILMVGGNCGWREFGFCLWLLISCSE